MEKRITHILRHKEGGAAVAAKRLVAGQVALNWPVKSLSSNWRWEQGALAIRQKKNLLTKVQHTLLPKAKDTLEIQAEMTSWYKSAFDLNEHLLHTDVLHLHWVANFLDWPHFFSSVEKPFVWTLHDMNPLMGIFHYHGDVDRNPQAKSLENEAKKAKKRAFDQRKKEGIIVSPSKWLMEASKNSEIFKDLPHYHIPYGLPLDAFKPLDQAFCRDYFSLPHQAFILLFVSDVIDNYRKGFDLLLKALEQLPQKDIFCLAIGETHTAIKDVYFLGKVSDEKLLPLVYNCCDAFVLPSREDNLPNTMLEAMACGKPVVAFNTGGMAEHIEHGQTGYLAEAIEADALAQAIEQAYEAHRSQSERDKQSAEIRRYAEKQFDLKQQAAKYAAVYESLE